MIRMDGKRENLGILVPMGDGFGLDTRIPVKRLPDGQWEFIVLPGKRAADGLCVAIKPEEPFAYIARLKEAYLMLHEDRAYAVLKEN